MVYDIEMQQRKRYWEIDLIRGIAVILMIIYHIVYDINFLGIVDVPIQTLPFLIFLYPIGTLFLLLVGISLTLRFSQRSIQFESQNMFFIFLKQGMIIFSLGMLITVITFVYPHNGFVVFGVLHCIGISMILGYFFISRPILSLLVGFFFIATGILVDGIQVPFLWLVWLGIQPLGFYTLDYFPLVPWFGIVLIGIFLGSYFYPSGTRRFNIQETVSHPFLKILMFLGRESLPIYLIHQPLIFGLLYVFFIR